MLSQKSGQSPSSVAEIALITENLHQIRRQQEIIERLLRLSFTRTTLDSQLSVALNILIEIPWLSLTAKGAIFILDQLQPETLSLRAQHNMDRSLAGRCATIRFGECLCGQAARDKKFIFTRNHPNCPAADRADHAHYVIPILHGHILLGILMLYGEADHSCSPAQQTSMATIANTLALLIERQQTADRLQISEANLAKAQSIAQLGYWDWHIQENNLFWSAEVYRIFDLDPQTTPATYENFLSSVHLDDRARVRQAVEQSLKSKAPYSLEHRIIRRDGSLRVVHERGEVSYAANGQPVRMFGTVQDITLRKHGKQQLDLATKVFETSIEGITITDATGKIQSVNRAFTQITGYSPEEAIGKNPNILKSDRHDSAFYQAMWQALLNTGRWAGEIWNRKKNGQVYPERLTITAITDDFGNISHYVAVFHDLSEVRCFEEQLCYQANHDALTGLPNRTLLLDRIAVAISHAQRTMKQLAVLTVDLDNFKHVNDSLGHSVGDLLLQQVTKRLNNALPKDTTIARFGGDSFAILLEQLAGVEEAIDVAEQINSALGQAFNLPSYETVITVSIGIAFFPEDGNNPGILLQNAELAMYRAKEEGKNKYQLFTKAMHAKALLRLSLENNLRKALCHKEFKVYYQPRVSLGTGRIVGMEALARWLTADGRLVSPLDFIPLAEETGLIVPLGEQILRQACLDAKGWLQGYDDQLTLAVNLSPRQFSQKDLLAAVVTVLRDTDFPLERLELEITESAVMVNEQAAIKSLLEFKKLGLRLALDDFGTGYSSLHYLRKLPLDTIKIDRSFVQDLPGEANSAAIAVTILTLAENLGLDVVAEGVENIEQFNFLKAHHCKEIQGYFFSPPIPAKDFEAMLQNKTCLKT